MKRFLFAVGIVLAAAQALRAASVIGELYDPCPDLKVISTRHFEIVYSPASADTAAVLASYADEIYEDLAAVYKPFIRESITVILTPDPRIENGFSSPVPYDHIVLADYRSGSFLYSRDYFRELFTHELAHIVSLNVKSDFFRGLGYVFGNTMNPNLSVPGFLLEGVTVTSESRDGAGRVNDPAVLQQLRQDIIENRFKNPAQASGPYDRYPGGNVKYYYGGLFSDFLQKKYGLEKYADLWRVNGGAFPYTMSFNFESVYQTNLYDSWNEFRESLKARFPVGTNIVPAEGMKDRLFQSTSAVLNGGRIYFSDGYDLDIKVYDIRKKTLECLLDGTGEIAVSPDGRYLLVTMMGADSGVIKNVTRMYDLKERRWTARVLPELGQVVFFNDSIVAVRARNHKTDLVLVAPDGSVRTLLAGTDDVSVENPAVLNASTVLFILVENGQRRIARLAMDTGELSVADIPARFIRDLSVTPDGRIVFAHNPGESFFKAGLLTADTFLFQTNNLSGGVFLPMLDGTDLYYFGNFSEGHRLLRMDVPAPDRSGNGIQYSWKPYAVPEEPVSATNVPLKPRSYSNFKYILPHVWLPYATFGRYNIPDSLGIYTVLMDPIYQNSVTLYTTYNYYKVFQNVSVTWENTSLPVHVTLAGLDLLGYYPSLGYARKTGGSVEFSYLHRYAPYWHSILAGTGFRYSIVSTNTGEATAYAWPYVYSQPVWTMTIQFSTAVKKYRFFDYKGLTITAYYDYQPVTNIYKTEASLTWYPSLIPLKLRLSGGFSFWNVFSLGGVNDVFGYNHFLAYREYASDTNFGPYALSGEAAVPVFNWDIQQGIWMLPLYFKRMYLLAGYRGAYLAEHYVQSVFARAELVTTPFYGGLVPDVRLWAEGAYAITSGQWDYDLNFTVDW